MDANSIRSNMISRFTRFFVDLLKQLEECFPECEKTASLRIIYNNHIANDGDVQDNLARQWYADLSPHFDALAESPIPTYMEILDGKLSIASSSSKNSGRCPDPVTVSKSIVGMSGAERKRTLMGMCEPAYIFEHLGLRNKMHDPTLDEDSKRYILCYILNLSGFSTLYDIIPNDAYDIAAEQLPDIMQIVQKNGGKPDFSTVMTLSQNAQTKYGNDPRLEIISGSVQGRGIDLCIAVSFLCGCGLEGGNIFEGLVEMSLNKGMGDTAPPELKTILPLVQSYLPTIAAMKPTQMMEYVESGLPMLGQLGAGGGSSDPTALLSNVALLSGMMQTTNK